MSKMEMGLAAAGILTALLVLLLLTSWMVRTIRGRTPAERAARNFAQHRKNQRESSKREIRNYLVYRFFVGIWRCIRWVFTGIPIYAGKGFSRVTTGRSIKATATRKFKPTVVSRPSGRFTKVVTRTDA